MRSLKTLLKLVKVEIHNLVPFENYYGFCSLVDCMFDKYQLISKEELDKLNSFFKESASYTNYVIEQDLNEFGIYSNYQYSYTTQWLFKPGDWDSRIKWLEEEIEKIKDGRK